MDSLKHTLAVPARFGFRVYVFGKKEDVPVGPTVCLPGFFLSLYGISPLGIPPPVGELPTSPPLSLYLSMPGPVGTLLGDCSPEVGPQQSPGHSDCFGCIEPFEHAPI